jgi:hypothetical protein
VGAGYKVSETDDEFDTLRGIPEFAALVSAPAERKHP